MSDERVIGVVPFGPLGIHPDAAVDHEIAELRQERHQQLLDEVHLVYRTVAVEQQLAVGADRLHGRFDALRPRAVVIDRVLRVGQQRIERANPVGHVRVAENRLAQQPGQAIRMKRLRELEQLLQVNDLVIAPVADVTPRIIRVLDLPVDAFLGDAIRVVTVDRRRVDEFGDHALDEFGKAERQRFPVLEDVAPVALVGEERLALGVADANRELVPWPARVAVTAPEGDRQVLVTQPLQLQVTGFAGLVEELARGQGIRQAIEQDPVAQEDGAIERADRPAQIAGVDRVLVMEHAAAEDIEHDVRIVVGRDGFFVGLLEAVAAGGDPGQRVGSVPDGLPNVGCHRCPVCQLVTQGDDLALRQIRVRHDLP